MSINKRMIRSRREFLKQSSISTAGLVVGFYLAPFSKISLAEAAQSDATMSPNAFIKIAPDNSITIIINKLEMGQGIYTSMAQLIAEELECDWKQIKAVSAPVSPVYNHTIFGTQITGGSSALASSWDQHRKIGASLREMLKAAAAQLWKVPLNELRAENGAIIHAEKGRLTYGELATLADQVAVPSNPPLKDPKDYKIIGKSMKRVDAVEKSNGTAVFGIDVRIPKMLYAAIARPPLRGANVLSFDERAARLVSGVIKVLKFEERIAVLATNTHSAFMGRDALNVQWKDDKNSSLSTQSLMASFKSFRTDGLVADARGDVSEALAKATKIVTAEYEFPFLCHAPMEPLNCTINFDGDKANIWAGHQIPTIDRDTASKILEIPKEKIEVHTTYAGGSFGRRANKNSDYVTEACQLAKLVKKPLKVVWSREDDMRGGYYRPMNYHQVKIGFNSKNEFIGWDHTIVGQSVVGDSIFESKMVKNGLESLITEGVAGTRYGIAPFRCRQNRQITPITTQWWRAVGHTHTAYVMETMLDELAEIIKKDPLKLRFELLKNSPRHLEVLRLLEKKTRWGKAKIPRGRAWGLAIHESFNSIVGQVAEVSIANGFPKVHKVWAAVHCGKVVNPEGAKAQIESSIAFGLSAALDQEIQVVNGRVQQGNFHDFRVMRIGDLPKIEVEFVKTEDAPTGLGEPGLPPIAPCVANAIYRLNKKRIRILPFTKGMVT